MKKLLILLAIIGLLASCFPNKEIAPLIVTGVQICYNCDYNQYEITINNNILIYTNTY